MHILFLTNDYLIHGFHCGVLGSFAQKFVKALVQNNVRLYFMAFDFGMFEKPCIYINYDQERKVNSDWSVK